MAEATTIREFFKPDLANMGGNLVRKTRGDRVIWAIVVILTIASLLLVYSSTGSLAYRMSKSTESYLFKQFAFIMLGLMVIYFAHRINYTIYSRVALILFLISIPLLMYTLLFGVQLNAGSRWIRLPVINMTFQTSDLAKLALFMYMSRQLSRKQNVIKDFKKGFLPIIIPVAVICLLIAPANLSTAVLVAGTSFMLMFIGRVSTKHMLLTIGVALVPIIFLVSIAVSTYDKSTHESKKLTGILAAGRIPTWVGRIQTFVYGTKEDEGDKSYQIDQAKIAIARGGWLGKGPGNSQQRNFLPHSYSDFIYAIIIEEYGIFGAALICFIYLLFLYRCIRIYRKCPYAFGAFLALALSFTLVIQAIANMGVNVNLFPNTGVTLPLVSMGGSSFLFTCLSIGIILSVARNVEQQEGKTAAEILKKASAENETAAGMSDEKKNITGQKAVRIIIAGGGTGGHIFPAIAIANAVKKIAPETEFLFVGAKGRMEMEKVPLAGYQIKGLDIAGFNRSSLIKNIGLPFKLVKSFLQVSKICKAFQPDAVIGVGGYSSYPVLRYAQSRNIPTFIHESNSFAGKSNKLLGKKARMVFTASDGMQQFFPAEKIMLTGNPVRQSITQSSISREEGLKYFGLSGSKKTVLVTGGSLGARSINEAIDKNIGLFEENNLQLIWQTGKPYYEKASEAVRGHDGIFMKDFITQPEYAYAAADVVISRSGAMAVAELCLIKKPVIFVPYPFAAEDHQTANAKALVNKHAALMIKDADAANELVPTLLKLVKDEAMENELKKNIGQLGVHNADEIIALEIMTLLKPV